MKAKGLAEYARDYLIMRASVGDATDSWLRQLERYLQAACDFFGAGRTVSDIRPTDVKRWIAHLRRSGLSSGSQHHHLSAVSGMFAEAIQDEVATFNPVQMLRRKPRGRRDEATFFEIDQAALIIEGARLYRPRRVHQALPFPYPLVAALLLTGGRLSEVIGLEWADISFDRGTVRFGPNDSRDAFMARRGRRGYKTLKSIRTAPLWPQLQEILEEHLDSQPPGKLVFGTAVQGREQPPWPESVYYTLDAIGELIEWQPTGPLSPARIRPQAMRNTYCAARLQTLDRGHPVAVWTVSREMGHSSTTMVEKIYGHLGTIRHRAEVVEYRVEHHGDRIGERVAALRANTG